LANLVAAILEAQGYKLQISPEGPDGGIDIIAGRGALGFESPRLAVQVKSGDAPVDVKVLRELQGVMKNFGAEQGLVVAWGGYRQSVPREATRLFFEIRLWDSDDLIDAIQAHYDSIAGNRAEPNSAKADLDARADRGVEGFLTRRGCGDLLLPKAFEGAILASKPPAPGECRRALRFC
jgi:restriction system protein